MNKNIFSLRKKIVIITGATGLLGSQHVDAVATFGGIPILLDLNKTLIKNLQKKIKNKYGINTKGYVVDITDEDAIKKNCKEIISVFGKIDALINNATNNPQVSKNKNFSRLENFQINNWEDDVSVGLKGAFLCSKYYGSKISENENGGVIINISSDLGLIAPDQRLYQKKEIKKLKQPVKPITYSVVKTGIIGLTRYLSTYWPQKVRSNTLCPGGVNNNLPEEFVDKVNKLIPMGRMASPDEYQGAIVFLLSDASKYMNGACLTIDGGRTIY